MANLAEILNNVVSDSGTSIASLQPLLTNPVTGTGTTNYIPKWSGATAIGDSQIFDNGTSVGIGTASPTASYLLDINGNTYIRGLNPRFGDNSGQVVLDLWGSTTGSGIRFRDGIAGGSQTFKGVVGSEAYIQGNTSSGFIVYAYSGQPLYLYAGGQKALNIFSNQNVAIGTTTDGGFKLDVNGTARIGTMTLTGTATNQIAIGGTTTGNSSVALGSSSTAALQGIAIGEAASANQNSIAIGRAATTTAQGQLVFGGANNSINDVYFGRGVTAATNDSVTINVNGASGTDIAGASLTIAGGKATGTGAGGDVIFSTSDATTTGATLQSLTTKMIVKAGGSVGIGTTSPNATFKLHVVQSANQALFEGATQGHIEIKKTGVSGIQITSPAASELGFYSGAAGAYRMYLFSNGNFGIGVGTTDAGYKLRVNGSLSIGTGSVIAGWDFHNSGTFRQEGNMYVVGTLQAGTISQPGSAMTINIISSLGRNMTFVDGAGSTNGDYIRFFSTNTIGNITSGTANLLLVNPTINQTTGAGTIIGYRFNPTNTAVVSSVYSFYADSGTAYFGSNVGVGTASPNASALVDITSTTKGFLPPRMTSTQRAAISSPAVGLVVYQTDATEGTYEYTSSGWRVINGGGSSAYSVTSVTTTHTETATSGTKIIKADTTGGAFTINLPTAVSNTATIIIKKTAGSGALTVDGNGTQTIDGGLTAVLNEINESITLISDNSNWQIV